ncbi:hypothetical protein GQ607_010803 [Colletotrichum asianum]|uniref:Uncharacterized protein n=1 Tax=Colletotrichum asianum TaxID=702518 RepID=A0A8H3W8Q3_9PEZI|nr:hypothetical protein GQ607_010803 [Colletotrichum asianum]
MFQGISFSVSGNKLGAGCFLPFTHFNLALEFLTAGTGFVFTLSCLPFRSRHEIMTQSLVWLSFLFVIGVRVRLSTQVFQAFLSIT